MAHARDALWESGHDESVEVNQRALIDKVLARYSGEFTVFRELLQNSDDASATAVEIHFETKEYLERKNRTVDEVPEPIATLAEAKLPDLKTALVHQWTFKNNGVVFRDEDWSRLKKIAEGNPDEEKIGAFGVGFYSLFSVTEEPFVTSGGQWMGFYWKDKKDQLFARRGKLPESAEDPWTSFEMGLREPTPIPPPFDFTRFLASSITFMRHLLDVSVFLDDKRLSRLTKAPGAPQAMSIPKGLKPSSPLNTMQVNGIQTTPLSIRAEVMQWVYMAGTEKPQPKKEPPKPAAGGGGGGFFTSLFSSLTGSANASRAVTPAPAPPPVPKVDPLSVVETNVMLSIFAADIAVKLDQKMIGELHRSTKKNPPTRMKYELIYTGKAEYDASKSEDEKHGRTTGSVFQGLRADIDGMGQAKVFIGHSTGQTTGIGGHMSARFIPTVERESIDLVDRNVAVWNKELLYVGGFLARSAYEIEMEHIQQVWSAAAAAASPGTGIDPVLQASLRARAIHALRFFTFHPSTPSSVVSVALEEAFFSCITSSRFSMISGHKSFPIISTAGVRDAAEVRYPDPTFSGFVKELPVVPADVLKDAKPMVDALRTRGMIKDITFVDVLQELRNRPLGEPEMIACFKWWIDMYNQSSATNLDYVRTQLVGAAVLSIEEKDNQAGQIIPLSVVESFLSRKSGSAGALIPTDGPLPPHLLPVAVSRNFDSQALESAFGWRELTIVEWLKHITSPPVPHEAEHHIELSAPWAERVLQVVARAWPSLPSAHRVEVATILRAHSCVPTSAGLRKPADAYFQSAHIFNDLPVVTLPSGAVVKGPLEKFLQGIGVRKHVDLQIIFDRMIKTGDWTIAELIKYLVAVQTTLTAEELERLQMTTAFLRERVGDEKVPRYRAGDLYEPLDVLRELKLPVIDWGTHPKWRSNSEEAKFLFKLGLRRYPPLPDLIGLAASGDEKVRSAALKYLLDNYSTRYADYDPNAFSNVPFIPAVKGGKPCMAKPHEVFSAPEWAALGFMVTEPSLKGEALTNLKVQEHPPGPRLVNLLRTSPPPTEETAKLWFAALAGRVTSFSNTELRALGQLAFVPVKATNGAIRHLPPTQCYFKGDSQAQFHSKLFTFVDFGTTANAFLSACGVKHEPSVEEVAKILLDNPRRFYELAEGRENYLTELRNIAVNMRLVTSGTMARLKRAAFLLGSRRVRKEKAASGKKTSVELTAELEEEDWEYQHDLLTPDKVVIADDTNAYQLFGDVIFTAPQEDLLEAFYLELGCRRLSGLMREDYQTRSEVVGSRKAAETRTLILERLPLFLHEHTHTKTRVSHSWLNNEKNFVVKTFGKLTVTKTLQLGDKRASKSQDASAVARRIGRGPIELWLAGHDTVDMYEVSTSMCRLLFDAPKVNDALLFMTILSTDLRALRRRGYNVDRILRQQKADRQAAEEAVKAKQAAMLASQGVASASSDTLVSDAPKPNGTRPGSPLFNEKESAPLPPIPAGAASAMSDELTKQPSRPMSMVRQSLDAVKRRLQKENGGPSNAPLGPSQEEDTPSDQLPLLPPRPNRPLTPQPHATPRSSISSNIDLAIKACKEERGEMLKNRRQMQMVKESLNEGYCDISGHPADMTLIGDMGGIKIFVAKDVPDGKSLMRDKSDALARFIYTIRPLQEVYTLPPTSLHIFYDRAGDTIAFNRNASLFLNLRFFEQWHDAEVGSGQLTNAYISWYFTLAHEIAHNLVQAHNSEHEFYFSSICEQYLPAFMKLIAGK
ncbi:uncharacterized protein TRAVEDRAFT_119941 [Trametes versicolor FP-101664 SS1]|uniref:uncharacterized protein n=1 Tax=Trametes versicolor (strain FP-101664) TaxID=717944 RepID=UPI0004622C60|nr:uncharacterized protein TRAVEDRAFT_119941 [Trametes versicolor FP-101664 SS1]EIW60639.1 hypothetical protein TRAVEDRAFT_119941 [Trametes versicolor FP-101664 SS1]